ncbi:MAG: hypothetical protein ACLQVG_20905 [Terriglobia bacterium]
MPTAIARICTPEGIVIAADGFEAKPSLEPNQSNLQKIYPVPGIPLAYAIFGTTGTMVSDDKPPVLDLIEEAKKSANSIVVTESDDILAYIEKFSHPIQEYLLLKREDGSIPYYPSNKDGHLPGRTITHVFLFGYYQGIPWTVDLRFFHINQILHDPSIVFEGNDLGFPPFIRGSVIVGNLLFNSKDGVRLGTPADERLSAYRKSIPDNWENLTISQASEIAREYIRACDSDIGREVDPVICRQIGGYIHLAKITPSEGFQWIISPRT